MGHIDTVQRPGTKRGISPMSREQQQNHETLRNIRLSWDPKQRHPAGGRHERITKQKIPKILHPVLTPPPSQTSPRRSLLSARHTISRHTFTCNCIYVHTEKYCLRCPDFHKTHKCLTALRADHVY